MRVRRLAVLLCACLFLVGCGSSSDETSGEDDAKTTDETETIVYDELSDRELEVYSIDGDTAAQLALATRYDYGTAESGQDFAKAKQYYEMAATGGNATALRCLGYYYLDGVTEDVDLDTAVDYFMQAVDAGDVDAYVGIGRAYLAGYENPSDDSEEDASSAEDAALHFFTLASADGGLPGRYYLSYLTETMADETTDLSACIATYEEIAALDAADVSVYDAYLIAASATRLGICYLDGKGVEVDYDSAMDYLLQAGDYAPAEYYIGQMYENGIGTDVDYEEAVDYYLQAADDEYAPALTQLGYLYYMGYGVDADLDQAIYYEKLAAMQGYATAQINLGYLYENGIGVTQDLSVALSYYEMAAAQGNEGAEEAVVRVRSSLNAG